MTGDGASHGDAAPRRSRWEPPPEDVAPLPPRQYGAPPAVPPPLPTPVPPPLPPSLVPHPPPYAPPPSPGAEPPAPPPTLDTLPPPPPTPWSDAPTVRPVRDIFAGVRYAGFWRRFASLFLDNLLLNLAYLAVAVLIGLPSRLLGQPFLFLGSLASLILNLVIWWKLIPSAIGRRGGTIGMKSLGIQIVTTRDFAPISTVGALLRMVVQFVLALVAAIPAAVYLGLHSTTLSDEDWWVEHFSSPVNATLAVLLVIVLYVPHLWMLVDRRRQTLFDKVLGMVVIEARSIGRGAT